MFIGRRGLFSDEGAIIAHGNITHFLQLKHLVAEAVVISPHRALFIPFASAKVFSEALTSSAELRKISLQYRKSGPHGASHNLNFALPVDLAANLRAEKLNAIIARAPEGQATLLKSQVNVEVLGIEGSVHENVPQVIIQEICRHLGNVLTETEDQIKRLDPGEWRKDLRAGSWSGRLVIQLLDSEDIVKVFDLIEGRTICLGGIHRTIAVTCPCNPQLGNRSFMNSSASVSSAG